MVFPRKDRILRILSVRKKLVVHTNENFWLFLLPDRPITLDYQVTHLTFSCHQAQYLEHAGTMSSIVLTTNFSVATGKNPPLTPSLMPLRAIQITQGIQQWEMIRDLWQGWGRISAGQGTCPETRRHKDLCPNNDQRSKPSFWVNIEAKGQGKMW